MYTVNRMRSGRVASIRRLSDNGDVSVDSPEFLDWNAKQPVPLDLSDSEPEPPVVDREAEAFKVLLEKPEKDLALADLKAPLLKLLRERFGVSSKS